MYRRRDNANYGTVILTAREGPAGRIPRSRRIPPTVTCISYAVTLRHGPNYRSNCMTWALCLNCGEKKFGAIVPCPNCGVGSSAS